MSEHRRGTHHHHHHRRYSSWFHIPHYHGQRKIYGRDIIKSCVILSAIIVFAYITVSFISRWENEKFATSEQLLEAHSRTDSTPPKSVMADGVRYELNTNQDVYLFIGVDVNGKVADMQPIDGGGQGDVQMVLVMNHDAKTWQILQLNRDSMVNVPILGMTGKVVGQDIMQLALAHSYGTGAEDSCRNNVNAVSQLLWDQFINGYVALNMEGIALVNDALGGVEVTILPEYGIPDSSMTPGSRVLLTGSQAVTFLRGRQGVGDETNLSRMSRQRQYMQVLSQKIKSLELGTLIDAYEASAEYTVTNLDLSAVTDIAAKLQSYQQLELLTVKGEDTVKDDHAAYILDEADLQKVILQLFYHKQA